MLISLCLGRPYRLFWIVGTFALFIWGCVCYIKNTDKELHSFLVNTEIPSNIYVHATNSRERVVEYKKYYTNFELDVFIDSKTGMLDIYHFPEDTSTGFYLDALLGLLDKPSGNKFWLDVKNLTPQNLSIFNAALSKIIDDFSLKKSDFLVESHNNESLAALNKLGYSTSFYLPASFTVRKECPSDGDTLVIIENIKRNKNSYISFPLVALPLIDACLMPHLGNLGMLSWASSAKYISSEIATQFDMFIIDHTLGAK